MANQNGRTFAVIGLGTFGTSLCEGLIAKGGKVLAIDNQPRLIDKVKESATQSILIDSSDEESMGQVPFEDVDTAIVAIGDNLEASILTTAILKKIGVPRIIARALTDIHQDVLRRVGADEIINIEIDEGYRLAQKLVSPDVLDHIPISDTISLAEVAIPKEFAEKTLLELDLRRKMSVSVVAIRRTSLGLDEEGNTLRHERVLLPGAEDVFKESDIVLVVGDNESLTAFKALGL